jgi:hypothetical protein
VHARPSERLQFVHCDRTVAPKCGRLRSWTGNRDLNMLFMRFNLVIFFFDWNFNKILIQSLYIRFVFMMFFRLDA